MVDASGTGWAWAWRWPDRPRQLRSAV